MDKYLADYWALVGRHRAGPLVAPAELRVGSDRIRALIAALRDDDQRPA